MRLALLFDYCFFFVINVAFNTLFKYYNLIIIKRIAFYMGMFILSLLIVYIITLLLQRLYYKLTPVVVDMRELEGTNTTYLEWNNDVFNPALRRAYRMRRSLHVIRYNDSVNRGKPNDKFIIDETTHLAARPLPNVIFK